MPATVILPSKPKYAPAQEKALIEFIVKRHADVRDEMGFMDDGIYTGWLKERQEAQEQYDNDFKLRKDADRFGPLYATFNDSSLNIPKRAVMVWVARAREALLNSQPFAGLSPEGEEDQSKIPTVPGLEKPADPIKLLDRFWNNKLAEAEANIHFRGGLQQAAVSGETVYKITKKLEEDGEYEDGVEKQVWVYANGEPLLDSLGGYVFADEEFEPDPDRLDGEILKRDPTVAKMPDVVLSEETYPVPAKMPRRTLDIRAIDFRDFICSPTAEDIHSTDYIAHTFDLPLDRLLEMLHGVKLSPGAREWVDGLSGNNSLAKTDSAQPNTSLGEKERGPNAPVILHMSESWCRFNPRGKGKCDELCVLWDVTSKQMIYYSLKRNASPTGKRPFEVDRVVPIKNRWHGMGFYRLLSNEHNYVDRQVVRLDVRTSTSGRFTYYRKGTLEGVENGWEIELNSPQVHTSTSNLKPGENPIENVYLEPMDTKIWDLLNMRLQQAQLMSGTMTPGDAAAVKLNPSETLGGQEMLAQESELMSADTTQDARHGIELTLKQSLMLILNDFNAEEARELLGVESGDILAEWVKTHKPKCILKYVKLLMTPAKNRKRAESNAQALQITTGGMPWIQLVTTMPHLAEQFKPLYQTALETSEIENIPAILSVPPAPALAPPMPGQPPVNPNESIPPQPAPAPGRSE